MIFMKFSLVIPTYNRPADLDRCLHSIYEQTAAPAEIIVIDDADLSEAFINAWQDKLKSKNLALIYYKKNHALERRGLAESKNKALELVNQEIFFILDDDVVLEPNFCELIMRVWEDKKADPQLVGVGGIIKNRRRRLALEKYWQAFFGLSSKYAWDVNGAGFQVWDEEIKNQSLGYYAHGGVCSYRLKKAKELRFSVFSGGRTALEDVDFCARAKQRDYYFIVEPAAQLSHYHSASGREEQLLMGYKEGANRRTIFLTLNKKPKLALWLWFYWASLGWMLRSFLVGNFSKGFGLFKGFLASQKGRDNF